MSFYGGYFGAILGLLGVIVSIIYSSREANEDRRNTLDLAKEQNRYSKMPFLELEDNCDVNIKKIEIDNIPYSEVGKDHSLYHATSPRKISFKNIGTGPATDIQLNLKKTSELKGKIENYNVNDAFKTSVLDQGKEFDFCIIIRESQESLITTFRDASPYSFEISIEFKDMFDNKYIQQFKFAYKLATRYSIDGDDRVYYKLTWLRDSFNNGKPIFLN